MNIIRMTGGLGNQMFAYALLLKFRSMGVECMIDDYTEYTAHDNRRPLFLKDAFGIDYPVASKKAYNEFTDSSMMPHRRFARMIRGRKSREYHEKSLEFDPKILTLDNAYLTGYFQSDKYFSDIEKDVRESFTFTPDVVAGAEKILKDNGIDEALFAPAAEGGQRALSAPASAAEPGTPVSLHVRRGDYLNVSEVYGGICTDEYYRKATDYISEHVKNPVFLIFSNDTKWCNDRAKGMFGEMKYHIIEGTEESNGYIDMYLMSRCSHNILANSSFSWWGAYLNSHPDRIVLAPSRWDNVNVHEDIYTEYMTRI